MTNNREVTLPLKGTNTVIFLNESSEYNLTGSMYTFYINYIIPKLPNHDE